MGNYMESEIEAVEQHLLYHKAMAETPEELDRVNGYLETLRNATNGERLNDSVDEASRRMFTLVIENNLDPWDIDIEEFAELYASKVSDGKLDLVVAGKLMLMAWRVIHSQADSTLVRFEEPVIDDAGFEDDDTFVESDEDPSLMIPVKDIVFSRAHVRTTSRKVTLMDLMEAFDEAVEEEIRKIRDEENAKARAEKPAKVPFNNRAHEEDDETVVKRCYKAIIKRAEEGPVTMAGLYNGNLKDSVSFFVSVLHLVRYGLLEIEQDSLPRGTITIRVVDPTAEVPLATEA